MRGQNFSLLGSSEPRPESSGAGIIPQFSPPAGMSMAFDPIFNSTPDADARARMVSTFDWKLTVPERALGFHFDIVLRGRGATPREG
jgi:protocatechuate 3,4-dioxygenase beta subunit